MRLRGGGQIRVDGSTHIPNAPCSKSWGRVLSTQFKQRGQAYKSAYSASVRGLYRGEDVFLRAVFCLYNMA